MEAEHLSSCTDYLPFFFFFFYHHYERFLKSWFNFPEEKLKSLLSQTFNQLFLTNQTIRIIVALRELPPPLTKCYRVIIYTFEIESVKIILGCFLLIAGPSDRSASRRLGVICRRYLYLGEKNTRERTSATTR